MNDIIPPAVTATAPVKYGDQRLPARFWVKAQPVDGGCWIWTASLGHHGYGRFQVARKCRRAHRVAYEALVGPVPNGLVLDHLCRVRHCVNPAHLEPVTNEENLLRGIRSASQPGVAIGGAIINAAKTHCPQGHPYDSDNGGVNRRGDRYCRTCKNEQSKACRARRRAAAKAGAR